MAAKEQDGKIFQSTHPVWGATAAPGLKQYEVIFQSTHPVWGATDTVCDAVTRSAISIHAPRVGCDTCRVCRKRVYHISIHAPRVGCDIGVINALIERKKFQSTHPVWGATQSEYIANYNKEFQSTHPGVGCDVIERYGNGDHCISIHAPRVGCDSSHRIKNP